MVNEGLAGPAGYLLWLFNELSWWWIVTVLLALLAAFVFNSQLWTVVSRILTSAPHSPISEEA